MCGICGAIALNRQSVDIHRVKSMTDALAHRGPDDSGFIFFHTGCRHQSEISFFQNTSEREFSQLSPLLPNIEEDSVRSELHSHDWDMFLGHRRLSIIDPTPAGHQPMSDLSKNIWVVFNGEIYNFRELRFELERKGHRFRTQSDTEVIIYAYIEWGIRAVEHFNGMFALVIYDNFKKEIFFARDRYGVKPFYYAFLDGQLLFASEQKAMRTYLNRQLPLNKKALLEYFTFQNIFTDQTLLEGIKLFPAGSHVAFPLRQIKNGSTLNSTRYWDYCFHEPERPARKEEYLEELDRLFRQAVNRQLVSDVELGAYLSGGMDSGSITAVAVQKFPFLKTFTCGFDLSSASGIELGFDERPQAEAMSARFKTEHYEMVLKAGDMERCLPKLAWHLEEPRVGQSYPNYYASQLASKFVKVVLAGSGGDELFGGYPWRYYRCANSQNFEHYIDQYYAYWQRLVNNRDLKRMFAPVWSDVEDVCTRDIFRDVFLEHDNELDSPEDYINHSLYFEAKTFLHGLFLVEDKLSMAHGLETRVPFMDNDLVDFAMQCPVNLKLNNLAEVMRINENETGNKQNKYYQKTNDGKQILRDMMSRYVPPSVTQAEKQGFSSPDASWFKGESIEFVKRELLNGKANIYRFLDRSIISSLIKEHMSGEKNRRLLIWSLLNIERYLQKYT